MEIQLKKTEFMDIIRWLKKISSACPDTTWYFHNGVAVAKRIMSSEEGIHRCDNFGCARWATGPLSKATGTPLIPCDGEHVYWFDFSDISKFSDIKGKNNYYVLITEDRIELEIDFSDGPVDHTVIAHQLNADECHAAWTNGSELFDTMLARYPHKVTLNQGDVSKIREREVYTLLHEAISGSIRLTKVQFPFIGTEIIRNEPKYSLGVMLGKPNYGDNVDLERRSTIIAQTINGLCTVAHFTDPVYTGYAEYISIT